MMDLTSGKLTEELLAWLETDKAVKENPGAVQIKHRLVEKLAAKKRWLSAVSESNGCMVFGLEKCQMQLEQANDRFQSIKNGVNMTRYKTELCRSFRENGYCRYGEKCQFAHGILELRQTTRHPRYKTELCKAYHMNGFCPYGARCNFIHDVENPSRINSHNKRQSAPGGLDASVSTTGAPSRWNRSTSIDSVWPSRIVLGSTVDSPPQSVTESPTPSPTAMLFDPAFDNFPSMWATVAGQT